jgi:ferredoxin
MTITSWRQQESEKQVRAREANESTAQALAATRVRKSLESFVCECGDRCCTCAISLTLAQYESVREHSTHFAIAPDHENPESELVIAESRRFAVIETISPEARKLARRSDPRWAEPAGARGDDAWP